MNELLNFYSNKTLHCHFSDLLDGKLRLLPFYGDIHSGRISINAYLEKILCICPTKEYELYNSALHSLRRVMLDLDSGSAVIDCGSIESCILSPSDVFLKKQLYNIIPLAYKIRYGDEDEIVHDFKQVSESPYERTIVVTCKGYDQLPTALCTVRLDYNPNPEALEIRHFFKHTHPFRHPWAELCRFSFHPIFDIWLNTPDPAIKYRANLIRSILTRHLYIRSRLLFNEHPHFVCTMLRHVALFMKRTSGYIITPIADCTVNPENEYFIMEQKKYPKYFIPEQLQAYHLDFDLKLAKLSIPVDMVDFPGSDEKFHTILTH